MNETLNVETGVAILFTLRRRGYSIRLTDDGNLQVAPFDHLTDDDRKTIVKYKQGVLMALTGENADGAQGAERLARELLKKNKGIPAALATENSGEWTYVACSRRDGSGWTLRIPQDQFDAFRFAEALMTTDRELVTR